MAATAEAPPSPLEPPADRSARPRLRDLDRRWLAALVLVVALAFGLRLASALDPVADPGPDAHAYERIAEALFTTHRYGTSAQTAPTDWSPGAPLMFGGLYFLMGNADPTAARILEALLGTAMTLVVFLLGLRLAGRWAGLLAAFAVAFYPTFIENTGQMLSEPLAAFLLSAALLAFLWAADRARVLAWVVPGLLLGAMILTRPEYQAITGLLAVLAAWQVWRDRGWRPAAVSALVLCVAAAAPVIPWMARNHGVIGKWTISTGGGKAMFVATFLPGDGRQVPTKRELMRRYLGAKDPITTKQLKAQEMQPLLNRVAKRYPHLPRDQALGRIGKENMRKYLREQPAAYLKMTAVKAWNMWERGSSPAMRSTAWTVYHRLLLLLGIAGFALLAWRSRTRYAAIAVALPVVAISGIGALLLAVPRRQVPLMPLVAVFAAAALVEAVRAARSRRSAAA